MVHPFGPGRGKPCPPSPGDHHLHPHARAGVAALSTPTDVASDIAQTPSGAVAGGIEIAARSPAELFWRRIKQDKVALVSLIFIIVLVLVAILAPVIVKIHGAPPPNLQDRDTLDAFGT